MTLEELSAFIEEADNYLMERYYGDNAERRIYTGTIKLTEELGELCAEVLAHDNLQRKEKLAVKTNETMAEEFADVLITTLLLAHALKVDVPEALTKKIKKIRERYHQ